MPKLKRDRIAPEKKQESATRCQGQGKVPSARGTTSTPYVVGCTRCTPQCGTTHQNTKKRGETLDVILRRMMMAPYTAQQSPSRSLCSLSHLHPPCSRRRRSHLGPTPCRFAACVAFAAAAVTPFRRRRWPVQHLKKRCTVVEGGGRTISAFLFRAQNLAEKGIPHAPRSSEDGGPTTVVVVPKDWSASLPLGSGK